MVKELSAIELDKRIAKFQKQQEKKFKAIQKKEEKQFQRELQQEVSKLFSNVSRDRKHRRKGQT